MWDMKIKRGSYNPQPIRLRARASGMNNEAAMETAEIFQTARRAKTVGNRDLPGSIRKGGAYVNGHEFKSSYPDNDKDTGAKIIKEFTPPVDVKFVVLQKNHLGTYEIRLYWPCLDIDGYFFIEIKNDVKKRSIVYPNRKKAMQYYNMQKIIYIEVD